MSPTVSDWLLPYREKYNFTFTYFKKNNGINQKNKQSFIDIFKKLREKNGKLILMKFRAICSIHHLEQLIRDEYGEDYYYLNTEQMSFDGYLNCFKMYKDKTLDYSEEHIDIMKNNNYDTLHIPYLVNRNEIKNWEKVKDVAFISGRSKRRKNMHKIITGRFGSRYTWIRGWSSHRDSKLFRHKILINIHHATLFKINEQIRVNRCVFNKMIVISEKGYNEDLLYLKKYIIWCDYDKIPDKVEDVLNNYEKYYNELFKDFNLDEIEKHYDTIAENTIKKIDKK